MATKALLSHQPRTITLIRWENQELEVSLQVPWPRLSAPQPAALLSHHPQQSLCDRALPTSGAQWGIRVPWRSSGQLVAGCPSPSVIQPPPLYLALRRTLAFCSGG